MRKLSFSLSAFVLALIAAGSAQAVPLSFLLGDNSITAGDKRFYDWTVSWEGSDDALAPNYALIDVTALDDGGLKPGPGININAGEQMTVGGDGIYTYSNLTLGFWVEVLDPRYWIVDNSLTFGDPASVLQWTVDADNDLGIYVMEWVHSLAGEILAMKEIEFSVLNDVDTRDWSDVASFDPQQVVRVEKSILGLVCERQ